MRKKLFFAALAGMLAVAVLSEAQAPDKKGKLQSVNVFDIKEFDRKELLKKIPLETDKFVFNTFFLEPRQVLAFHKHPASDELFYIVEGRGQFTVGGGQVMVDSGSVVYGPADVNHGVVNSGRNEMVMISVQSPRPVKLVYAENSSIICPVCSQEDIIPEGAKDGDIFICPRCQAKLRLSKTKDGRWLATQA